MQLCALGARLSDDHYEVLSAAIQTGASSTDVCKAGLSLHQCLDAGPAPAPGLWLTSLAPLFPSALTRVEQRFR
jgi:hypothetical protein